MHIFFSAIENYTPLLFAALDEKDKLSGILLAVIIKESDGIKGSLSRRCVVWGGPVIKEDDNES